MDQALALLLAAAVGGGASFAATYLQTRNATRHERVRTAAELAAKEHDYDLQRRHDDKQYNKSYLAEYVLFYDALLRRQASSKSIDLAGLTKLAKQYGIEEQDARCVRLDRFGGEPPSQPPSHTRQDGAAK